MWIAIFILCTLIHCVGDYFCKRASVSFTWLDAILGAVLYLLTIPGWIWLMKFTKLAILSSIGSVLGIIMMMLIGMFVFHEHLSTREIIGVILAITAVVVLC